jgi:beta-glucosidase
VESLSVRDRYKKAIEAGTDLIGNDATPGLVVELVKGSQLTEARIDESVRRILRVRFALGIFENPYADPEIAKATVGKAEFQRKADLAQRKSIVLLKNLDRLLPLAHGRKVFAENVNPAALTERGYVVVATPEEADTCMVRVIVSQGGGRGGRGGRRGGGASAEPATKSGDAPAAAASRGGGRAFGPGGATDGTPIQLTLPAEMLERVRAVMSRKPTIVAIELDRPYVIPELAGESAALLATFGATDSALLDVISGRFNPGGKLPFELPSSMAAVERQAEDVPFDSSSPLFRYGAGLTYQK